MSWLPTRAGERLAAEALAAASRPRRLRPRQLALRRPLSAPEHVSGFLPASANQPVEAWRYRACFPTRRGTVDSLADSAWRSVGTVACRCDDAPAWRPSSGSGCPEPPEKSVIARPTRTKRPDDEGCRRGSKMFFYRRRCREGVFTGQHQGSSALSSNSLTGFLKTPSAPPLPLPPVINNDLAAHSCAGIVNGRYDFHTSGPSFLHAVRCGFRREVYFQRGAAGRRHNLLHDTCDTTTTFLPS